MSGLYFDEFEIGQQFDHPIRRTVTETDNLLFTTMTHNPAAIHLDAEYCKDTQFGQIIVNSMFTLALTVGISVGETTLGTAVANLGFSSVAFPKPVFLGDTLHVCTAVKELRESQSNKSLGIVVFEHQAINQRAEKVVICTRSALMYKKKPEA